MAFCSKCGATVPDGTRFCPQCGREVAAAGAAAPAAQPTSAAAGFFASLLDFSFTTFVTAKIIKVLYGLAFLVAGLLSLFWIVTAFAASTVFGILTLLIGAPLFCLITVVYARVLLELIIVVFRIAEHTGEMAQRARGGGA